MKANRTTTRPGHRLSGILLFFALFALLAAPGALACHKGKPHGKDAPPTCDAGPPGPEAPDVNATWGAGATEFDGDGIWEEFDRLCEATSMASDDATGSYDCAVNNHDLMHQFDYMASTAIHRRGDDWRCEPDVSGGWLRPDDEYSFSWSGDCTTVEGCDVTVVNRHSNNGVLGSSVDRLTLEAFAYGVTSSSSNPFAEAQAIPIDVLHLTMFSYKGNNKILAKCELIPHEDWPVVFYTTTAE